MSRTKKIGILTFHYSNNYGGVLQAIALFNIVKSLGFCVEIINFIPSDYKPCNVLPNIGIKKNIFRNEVKNFNAFILLKKVILMKKYCRPIINKFNLFRVKNISLSEQVDETSLESILKNYSTIIVGSDQVWNPSQRKSPIYFLDYNGKYLGKKISYAADSTIKDVNSEELNMLRRALGEFNFISVRNEHSYEFVRNIVNKESEIVADPTLLFDFNDFVENLYIDNEYILAYIIGNEIEGSHKEAIIKIRKKYKNIPVYAIKIPTMKFELSPFADKVFYDLDPSEWINMFRNAKFVYTDSFHGVLFSLKYHKPFLAYYSEKLRATRFNDLGVRYGIAKFIIQNACEIDKNNLLESEPDFNEIDKIIELQKKKSLDFLKMALA